MPAWSRGGDRLAAVVTDYDAGGTPGLYVYGFDWASQTLTAPCNAMPSGSPLGSVYSLLNPDWVRTGDRVAIGANITGYDQKDIWVISLSDLLHPARLTTTADRDENHPSWSPDDTHIVFHGTSAISRKLSLFLMRSDGTDIKDLGQAPVAPRAGAPRAPDWRRNP